MKFITTPSHGYLQLTHKEFITDKFMDHLLHNPEAFDNFGYGYSTPTHIYLEEDCEATTWLDANNIDYKSIREVYDEEFDNVRNELDSNNKIMIPIKNKLIELVGSL